MRFPLKMCGSSIFSPCLTLLLLTAGSAIAQNSAPAAPVFRLDGGNASYVFGVNERGELQTLYWGGRIGARDSVRAAHSNPDS